MLSFSNSIGQFGADDHAPLYLRLQELIRAGGSSGAIRHGEGLPAEQALQRLSAVPFGAERARMLGLSIGHAGLSIERRNLLHDWRAGEIKRFHDRDDNDDFVAKLSER